jgi:tetratricopeptide (TPR) repeat protein
MTDRRLAAVPSALLALALLFTGPVGAADEKALTPNAHFMSGKLYLSQKVFDKAEREFAQAVAGDTTNAEYRTYWATALCEVAALELASASSISDADQRRVAIQGINASLAEASHQFDLAAAMDPKKQAAAADDNRQHYWVDIYKQGLALIEAKRFEDAVEVFGLTNTLNPKDPSGVFQVAYANRQMGNTGEAVATAKRAKEMAQVRLSELGDCSQFKSSDRKKDCRKTVDNMNVIINNVDRFTRSNNVKLAEEELAKAEHATDPASRRAAYASAIGFYEEALQQDPTLNGVRFDLANTHFATAESFAAEDNKASATTSYIEAAGIFTQLADMDSIDAETKNLALYNGASALYSAEKYDEAYPLFKRYIDVSPREVAAWRLAGSCVVDKDRTQAIGYLAMGNALSDKAVTTPVEESVGTVKNLYASSAAAKALAELGNPEEVKTFTDEKNGGQVVTTWIWWTKGQARHYLNGDELGKVSFNAAAP